MIFRSAADLVMGAHFAFILFALLGGLLVVKRSGRKPQPTR
jgi:hypothetical protein